ncbi:MAG: tandem-95 repeat protein [Verrucomicrobiota bacterium JB025]|nr:Ig-like domain-containing protein [Verrucomicrobiota bacterium JB025]
MKPTFVFLALVSCLWIPSPHAAADTILYYDSVSGGTADALDRLDSQTDSSLVASSSATTTLGSNAVFASEHASQTAVQGLGDGLDKLFRFGSSAGGTGTMSGTLSVAHMANGPYIEVSFTAKQDLILNELSFKLYNNSNNASSYGARDAGLFVKVGGDGFSQFGDSFTSPTNNGNQGTVTFSGYLEAAEGDLVVLRIAFTDRTRTNNDNQAATRIGAINISASAGTISEKFRIISYNIHGGKGPDNEGTPETNLTAFRENFMQNEDLICLQEVDNGDCWDAVQTVFSDYPYRYRTINQETDYYFWETPKETSIAIISKYPFESTTYELIQIDPTYDKWQRHAQHVTVSVGGEPVHVFHFHNTYNFNTNDWEYEKSGMEKFRDYVYSELGISSLDDGGRLVMLGDFNLLQANVASILPTPSHKYDGRDHILSVPLFTTSGKYATVSADLSDHPAIWASIDLAGPTPNPMTWESAPAAVDASSVTMTATTANDSNGVQYYFTNINVADGSHDSGWQSSPVYTDTGLGTRVDYSYTVKARDLSVNFNETSPSAVTAVAEAPESVADFYETPEDQSLDIPAAGVLANDTDSNNDTLSAVLVSGVSHGSLTLNADGSFSYTPEADYHGLDSFSYKANDGALDSDAATVTITVTAVNDTPVAVDDSGTTAEDTALTVLAPGVLSNDSDVESSPLSAIVVAGPANGTLTLDADGGYVYTPAANYSGADSFTYKANDGALDSNVATVSLTVTAAPSGYASWESGIAWESGDDSSPTGDPDGDGVVNFLEFAFDLDPLVAGQDGLPALSQNGADYAYEFNNARPGISYEVLLSTDLLSWSDPAFAVVTSESSMPVTIPASEMANGSLFVRLRVSE